MKKILVIRFSAMGDVALTSPIITSVLEQNPNTEIVFLSRALFAPFFPNHENFHFKEADLKGKHKGILGLKRLHKELLKEHKFDAVIDLHDVLRSKILRAYFKASRIPCYSINKGRDEKKNLLKGKIPFQKLKHTTQRYLDVFNEAGMESKLNKGPWFKTEKTTTLESFLEKKNVSEKINKWVGIAPFAAHESKEWPLPKIKNVIAQFVEDGKTVFLFGGGSKEISLLKEIQKKYPKSILVAGNLKLEDELNLMSQLDVMIAMDSSNMHLASLVGIKVVSIWGATHHFLGFGPLNNEENIIEISKETLPCRPCSIYGKLNSENDKKCAKQAMDMITEETVINKTNILLA